MDISRKMNHLWNICNIFNTFFPLVQSIFPETKRLSETYKEIHIAARKTHDIFFSLSLFRFGLPFLSVIVETNLWK